jgi:hypothetical protein
MGITSNKSPWSLSRSDPHPRRGESPGAYSSPSRGDRGHAVRSPGKGPAVRRPDDNTPVVGGFRSPVEGR